MYTCFHCNKKIEDGSSTIVVLHGVLEEVAGLVDNKPGPLMYHEKCYEEIAGSGYCPQNHENPCYENG